MTNPLLVEASFWEAGSKNDICVTKNEFQQVCQRATLSNFDFIDTEMIEIAGLGLGAFAIYLTGVFVKKRFDYNLRLISWKHIFYEIFLPPLNTHAGTDIVIKAEQELRQNFRNLSEYMESFDHGNSLIEQIGEKQMERLKRIRLKDLRTYNRRRVKAILEHDMHFTCIRNVTIANCFPRQVQIDFDNDVSEITKEYYVKIFSPRGKIRQMTYTNEPSNSFGHSTILIKYLKMEVDYKFSIQLIFNDGSVSKVEHISCVTKKLSTQHDIVASRVYLRQGDPLTATTHAHLVAQHESQIRIKESSFVMNVNNQVETVRPTESELRRLQIESRKLLDSGVTEMINIKWDDPEFEDKQAFQILEYHVMVFSHGSILEKYSQSVYQRKTSINLDCGMQYRVEVAVSYWDVDADCKVTPKAAVLKIATAPLPVKNIKWVWKDNELTLQWDDSEYAAAYMSKFYSYPERKEFFTNETKKPEVIYAIKKLFQYQAIEVDIYACKNNLQSRVTSRVIPIEDKGSPLKSDVDAKVSSSDCFVSKRNIHAKVLAEVQSKVSPADELEKDISKDLNFPEEQKKTQKSQKSYKKELYALEQEYCKLRMGSDVIAWLQQHKDKHSHQIKKILKAHGLTIFQNNLSDSDCELIADMLHSHSPKSFGFFFSHGLSKLVEELSNRRGCKVLKLSISGLEDFDEATALHIINLVILCSASSLTLRSNDFNKVSLNALKTCIENRINKMQVLKVLAINNEKFDSNCWKCIAEITGLFQDDPLQLSVCDCGLNDEHLETFMNEMQGKKLKGLNVSSNRGLTENGFLKLGQLAKLCGVSSMAMTNSGLSSAKLNKFSETAKGAQIKTLVMNYNPTLGKDGMDKFQGSIKDLGVNTLGLAYCQLTDFALNDRIDELDVSGNSNIQHLEKIAEFVNKKLRIFNCTIPSSQLVSLKNAIATARWSEQSAHKLEEIEIGERSMRANVQRIEVVTKSLQGATTNLILLGPGMWDLSYNILEEAIRKYQYSSIRISPAIVIKMED